MEDALRREFVGLFVAVLVNACATPAPHPEDLMEADLRFARETAGRGVDGWVAAFDSAGLQFLSSGRLLRGHDQIRSVMSGAFADPASRLEWKPLEARVARGGLGYTHGVYRVVRVEGDGARTLQGTGRYLTVWRRGADGVWRVDADLGNADPEPDPEAWDRTAP